MSESLKGIGQLNIVVRDMKRSIKFYQSVGAEIVEASGDWADWAPHYASLKLPNGTRLDLDSEAHTKMWNAGWKPRGAGSGGITFFFDVATREDVDRIHAFASANAPTQMPPTDAHWGSRYAILEDPDGNSVGLMSPPEKAHRFTATLPQ